MRVLVAWHINTLAAPSKVFGAQCLHYATGYHNTANYRWVSGENLLKKVQKLVGPIPFSGGLDTYGSQCVNKQMQTL